MPPRNAGGGQSKAGTAGIIQVNPAAVQPSSAKASTRLKVIIRRLPPSLTRTEFEQAIGDDWKLGGGKVDWVEYRQGKIRSPGKLPEQSRAYLHLTAESNLGILEAKFLSVVFHDAKGTHRHPDLKHLPPALEFAPFQRVPLAKQRQDNRQGLIDQDPEYMAFLERETQVIPKAQSVDAIASERIKETVTSTPLIQALREKKAAKAKAAAAKSSAKKADDDGSAKGKSAKSSKSAAIKSDTKSKDAAKNAAKDSKTSAVDKNAPSANTPSRSKRERATPNIRSLLERDLGLGQSSRRSPKPQASDTEIASEAASTTSANTPSRNSRSAKKDKDTQQTNGTAPSNKGRSTAEGKPGKAQSAAAAPVSNTGNVTNGASTNVARNNKGAPNATSTKAYLKHANASQGITEEALRPVLAQFGDLLSLDIDKRKGTAVAEFKTSDGLTAALLKRTVSVGQGAVEVLEYRTNPGGAAKPPSNPNGGSPRGSRGRGNRGGGKKAPVPSAGAG